MNGPAPMRAALCVALSIALVFSTPVFALGPLEKNHPTVAAGTQAYNEGRYEDALAAFEAAKKENPDSPIVDFNIGNALYKLGRFDEAKQAWLTAEKSSKGELQEKDWFNLGNGFVQLKQEKDAIAAYRKALTLDPRDEQARHNLEVLLRKIPPKQNTPDGGTPDAGPDGGPDAGFKPDAGPQKPDGGGDGGEDGGHPDGSTPNDAGSDAGADGGPGDAGAQDGGAGDGGQGDGGSDGGADGGQQKGDGGQGDGGQQDGGKGENPSEGDGGADGGETDGGQMGSSEASMMEDAGTPPDLGQQDALNVLDSVKQNEKDFPLWRFQQHKQQRSPNEKDW